MQLSDYEERAIRKFGQSVLDGKWSNEGLVSLLKVISDDFLKAKIVSHFADDNGIPSQWARKKHNAFKIDGVQFIADNE